MKRRSYRQSPTLHAYSADSSCAAKRCFAEQGAAAKAGSYGDGARELTKMAKIATIVMKRRGYQHLSCWRALMEPLLNKSCIFCVVILFFCLAVTAPGRVIYVDDDGPADFDNIQAAIDDANDGDDIVVADGMYTGERNRDIDFLGKAITLRSEHGPENCVIDCDGTESDPHRGFYFHNAEGVDSVVQGFTITNGYGQKQQFGDYLWSFGGGIYCIGSGPSISNCVITGNSAIQGAGIFAWKNSNVNIADSTISNNFSINGGGGGIYCWENTAATIADCVIAGNAGRGIDCWDSPAANIADCTIRSNQDMGINCSVYGTLTISNCTIIGNDGAGILCAVVGGATAVISNSIISGNNNPTTPGGGLRVFTHDDGRTKITNCTITGNSAISRFGRVNPGGGISCTSTGQTVMTNSIVWNNVGGDIYLCNFVPPPGTKDWMTEPTKLFVSYSCVRVIFVEEDPVCGDPILVLGDGNIDADPCFAKPSYWAEANDPGVIREPNDPNAVWIGGDYHLKSQAGRWDAKEGRWRKDDVTSPCIDAGDPNTPVGHEPFPNGGRINMGAYGGAAEASKSYFGGPVCETIVAGDINGDCKVDFQDFAIMASHWLEDNTPVNSNSIVHFGIQYYVQTDKLAYHFGESVEMLFRITNLTDEDVLISCSQSPEFNLWVQKNGETIWMKVHGWYQFSPGICLSGAESKKISYIWDMRDDNSNLIEAGIYDVVGLMYNEPWNYENHGDASISEVGVPISITTNIP